MSGDDILAELNKRAGTYRGEGMNHEEQPFEGTLSVEPLVGGRAALLRYDARGGEGALLHREVTLVGLDEQVVLKVWPVMSELPVVLEHGVVSISESPSGRITVVFRHGDPAREEIFRQEITLDLWANGDLSWRHAWGLPHGVYKERSSARLKREP